jgi:CheY-like chemotaxis protein
MPKQKLVLIVEDEADEAELMRFVLEDAGFAVETASTAKKALASLAARKPSVMLLDILMPGEGGMAVLAKMKANGTLDKVPVIVVTAVAREVGVKQDLKEFYPGVGYLPKPFDNKAMVKLVKKHAR